MTTTLGYMELCRLCLVKDKVNVPIFDDTNDVRQIFLKITACLPVKVSRDDSLPKKICDTCLYKIDLLYQFWNTTINAEKQLLQWLSEIGVDAKTVGGSLQMLPQSHAHPHALQEEIMLKEERIDPEAKDAAFPNLYTEYPYPTTENNFDADAGGEEKPAKRKTRGRPAGKKKAKIVLPESDEESIESDPLGNGDPDDSDSDGGKIAKEEADSDEDYDVDNPESLEPTQFVDVPSAADAEQPGPSGLNKSATITAAGTSDQGSETGEALEYIKLLHEADNYTEVLGPNSRWRREYRCSSCPKTFNRRSSFLRHSVKHIKSKFFVCSFCPKAFKTKSSLASHRKLHTGHTIECDICHYGFTVRASYDAHFKAYPPERDTQCPKCDLKFHTTKSYLVHLAKVHTNNFVCYSCNSSFTNTESLKEHVVVHYQKGSTDTQCEFCGKQFACSRSLGRHFRICHLDISGIICDICGKKLSSKRSFQDHMSLHTGVKPLTCQYCGKCFTARNTLTVHIRTHTGQRPYLCTLCPKTFSQSSSLTIHNRTHSGEKPYDCNLCHNKFINVTNLKLHQKTKHKLL